LLHPAVVEKLIAGLYTCVLWNSLPGDWHDSSGWLTVHLPIAVHARGRWWYCTICPRARWRISMSSSRV